MNETSEKRYLMEHVDEAKRLDMKTDRESVHRQALGAGLRSGMRVADVGCGSGITTSFLHELVGPQGEAVGIDTSSERIRHAGERYGGDGIRFECRSFYEPLQDLGTFDFIWVRFVLEYHRSHSREIVAHLSQLLNPGGILCLVDLDHNSMNHFGLSARLEGAINGVMDALTANHDFDPYAGRKLYSYLYDLGLEQLSVDVGHHHLIFGELNGTDEYNWTKKVEVAARNSGYAFGEYPGGFEEFMEEFRSFFTDPRRFTYTPIIACAGRKPSPASDLDPELRTAVGVAHR